MLLGAMVPPAVLFYAPSLITGISLRLGEQYQCEVRCYDRISGKLLSSTISSQTGRYALFGLNGQAHYIVAIDSQEKFNAAIQDVVIG